ncbi:sporulation membrane protein YtrI [Bacillus cereus group sp. BfR-BA-01380]|uniref:sporulation membrane protein YtrI n=1 Tax=Bacillus cereus group sp. BfR-BA-01380 TaxID=2920324 RepID=UPI001F58BC2E|nr:sporulation membrane protein YtrI [Bacillus cereus group sp. BfR-BA-01380]
MKVPSSLSNRWKLFLGGAAVGGILSWIIFLYIYGVFQEEQTKTLETQEAQIKKLTEDLRVLTEDQKKENEENKNMLTIQEIEIEIVDYEKYNLNSLTVETLTTSIRDDLRHLLTQNIRSVANNKELLKKAIENKVYKYYDRVYRFEIETVSFDTTLAISVKIKQER